MTNSLPVNSLHRLTLIALVVAGAAACAGGPSTPSNRAPVASTITVSPSGTGMAGATSFVFSAPGANDPDGASLTYAWTFGDGSSGTSSAPTHVYAATGTYTVGLTVSDGQQSTTAPSISVTVGPNLTANWMHTGSVDFFCSDVPTFPGVPQPTCRGPYQMQRLTVTQSGGELSGSITPNVNFVPTGIIAFNLTGTVAPVSHPAAVRFTTGDTPVAALQNRTLNFSFEGETNAAGTTMTGKLTQIRKDPALYQNPGGGLVCGSRDPVVKCPDEITSSTSTFSRP